MVQIIRLLQCHNKKKRFKDQFDPWPQLGVEAEEDEVEEEEGGERREGWVASNQGLILISSKHRSLEDPRNCIMSRAMVKGQHHTCGK